MVRVKKLTGLPRNPNLCSSESSASSSDTFQSTSHTMARKRKENTINRAETLYLGPSVTLSLDDGSWRESGYLFVRKGDEIDGEWFLGIFPGSMITGKN